MHTAELLSAPVHGGDLVRRLRGRRVVVFLDDDGTLTPIVEHPDHAFLSEDMRRTVRELANR
jgi:trehalose 6-phosphate phosphatase